MADADTAPSWLTSPDLSLDKQAVVSSLPDSLNGNIDCQADSAYGCEVPTLYGRANSTGEVATNRSADYYPVYSFVDGRQHFIAIPNSDAYITYTTEPADGIRLNFNFNFAGSVTKSDPVTGAQYQINKPPDGSLSDSSGHRLAADYDSISFSENGRWMVVSVPDIAVVRVNLESFEVTPFATGFNYDIGLDPGLQTAITNDGRYVAMASKDFDRASIYDLDTCSSTPPVITGPDNCQGRSIQSYLTQQIPGFSAVGNIRFITDDALSFYASYSDGAPPEIAKFLLADNPGNINHLEFLAMGDSYISGEGAFDYQAGTDTDDNHCHLSLLAYPYLLGHDLDYDSYHSVACSGGTTNDIVNTSLEYAGQADTKIKRRSINDSGIAAIKDNFQPGYIDQLDFVSTYQPQAITLSVGGNDMGFSSIVKSCAQSIGTCYGSYEDRLELVQMIENQVFPKLVSTYKTIKAQGPSNLRLYVIGYPQVAKPGGDCAVNVHLNADEVLFSQEIISYLDSVIQQAAAKAGVFYVDTQNALDGHRLCEAKPGSVAMNGLTAGNDKPSGIFGPIGNESYHPNALGHELLENTILSATDNLTAAMPMPDPNASAPYEDNLAILDAPHSGRPINVTEYDPDISSDVVSKQSLTAVSISGDTHSLPPAASLQASLHSDPTDLGVFNTDDRGNLSGQISIPDEVPAGYHTLHFYGADLNGQPIDIYKIIYVSDSPTDLDGDGIPDINERCVGVAASGLDIDQDGIDDSCDGTIGPEPAGQVSLSAQAKPEIPAGVSQSPVQPKKKTPNRILGDDTTKTPSAPSLTPASGSEKPNPKILAAAGGACCWIVLCYAAYKFSR